MQKLFRISQNMIKSIALILVGSAATLALADDMGGMNSTNTLPPASTQPGVTYANNIKPIFDASCLKCHDSAKKPKAHLALDSLAGVLKGSRDGVVVVPGDSAKSALVLAVAHIGDPDTYMPKGKDAQKLTDAQIGLIRAWIDQGAK